MELSSLPPDLGVAARTPAARRQCIARLIAHTHIHSQDQLRRLLSAQGFEVTQGTLSRDLKMMRATKIHLPGGGRVYVLPEAGAPGQSRPPGGSTGWANQRLARLVEQFLVSVKTAHGDVVLQTPPGAAQLLASAVDDAMLPGVLGTIAGDDTILVPTTSETAGVQIARYIASLADSLKDERRP